MKYIKLFESITNSSEFKNYLVYKVNNDIYFILQYIYNISNYEVITKKCYLYSKILNNTVFQKGAYCFNTPDNVKNIIYQSDDIEDCISVLPTLQDIEKFNL